MRGCIPACTEPNLPAICLLCAFLCSAAFGAWAFLSCRRTGNIFAFPSHFLAEHVVSDRLIRIMSGSEKQAAASEASGESPESCKSQLQYFYQCLEKSPDPSPCQRIYEEMQSCKKSRTSQQSRLLVQQVGSDGDRYAAGLFVD